MKALAQAFVATTYRVETPEGEFNLRVGEIDTGFESFLTRQGITCWGIVTGFNPAARLLPEADNQQLDRNLRDRLHNAGYRYFRACNIADTGNWPDEPGYFVPDVAEDVLLAVARELGQLAVLAGRRGNAPELVGLGEM